MIVELGKMYVDRLGRLYGPVVESDGRSDFYSFMAGTGDGKWHVSRNGKSFEHRDDDRDLVSEYPEVMQPTYTGEWEDAE